MKPPILVCILLAVPTILVSVRCDLRRFASHVVIGVQFTFGYFWYHSSLYFSIGWLRLIASPDWLVDRCSTYHQCEGYDVYDVLVHTRSCALDITRLLTPTSVITHELAARSKVGHDWCYAVNALVCLSNFFSATLHGYASFTGALEETWAPTATALRRVTRTFASIFSPVLEPLT